MYTLKDIQKLVTTYGVTSLPSTYNLVKGTKRLVVTVKDGVVDCTHSMKTTISTGSFKVLEADIRAESTPKGLA